MDIVQAEEHSHGNDNQLNTALLRYLRVCVSVCVCVSSPNCHLQCHRNSIWQSNVGNRQKLPLLLMLLYDGLLGLAAGFSIVTVLGGGGGILRFGADCSTMISGEFGPVRDKCCP